MKRLLLLIACLGCFFSVWAQEVVSELHYNQHLPADRPLYARSAAALSLPFFDDFSSYKGYPKPELWSDIDAYVNTTYPIEPLNLGVATLDGLDSLGFPRNISAPSSHGDADYLTTQKIDLSNEQNVFLSFYFQAGGIGNVPEENDVLSLEFLSSLGNWETVWDTVATVASAFVEKQFLISDTSYLHSDFQFRFHNKATLSGNFDHWHLDNVLLTNDEAILNDKEDMAFVYEPSTVLNNYSTMPWQHLLVNQAAFMANTIEVQLRNNYANTQSVEYRYDVFNDLGQEVFHYPTTGTVRNDNVFSMSAAAIYSYSDNSEAAITLYDYAFPASENVQENFTIVHAITTDDTDFLKGNDTLKTALHFENYYAYDDGTAEASYGVNVSGGMVAMQFTLAKADVLSAIHIYLAQNLEPAADLPFRFTVWENESGAPGEVLYQSQELYPEYIEENNGFHQYVLENPVSLSGTVFIGWQQYGAELLNVGLDKNNTHNDKLFYNIGADWENSVCADCEGVWMIRPVFGALSTAVETFTNKILIYPNPTNQNVSISYTEPFTLRVYNLSGQLVLQSKQARTQFKLEALAKGLYLVELSSQSGVYREKLIVQ